MKHGDALKRLGLTALVLVVGSMLLFFAVASAKTANGTEFESRIKELETAGNLSFEDALLYRFHYAFDPARLPAEFQPDKFSPLKSGTRLIHQYQSQKSSLSVTTRAIIDGYINRERDLRATEVYISSSRVFRLTYETDGTHAVPLADVEPANGVPDFVEKIADYFDTSWNVEITQLGFAEPPHAPYYEISFEQMGYYGYTAWVSGNTTKIVMHNSYDGFPPNTDPEGNKWGAAKVTAAHELKHASQLPQSNWSEGDWNELDATWTEDLVFDYVNDYYNYFGSPNNISTPSIPLDSGGAGTYEDSIWQHWMSETWGNEFIVDFAQWRGSHVGQSVMESYISVLLNNTPEATFSEMWSTYSAWNYATGSRAITGLGYGEAADYPTSPTFQNITRYPVTVSNSVAHLAADFVHYADLSQTGGWVSYNFNGAAGGLGLAAVIHKTDGTGLIEIIDLDEASDAAGRLSIPREEIQTVGFVVGNSALSGSTLDWSLTVDLELPAAALEIDPVALSLTLETDTTTSVTVQLTNNGAAGSLLEYTTFVRESMPIVPAKSIAGTTFSCNLSEYDPGSTVDLEFSVTNGSTDDEWLKGVQVTFPTGVTVNSATDFVGGSNPMTDDGSTGDGAKVVWYGDTGSPNYWGVVGNGQTANATVNVTFGAGLTGDLALSYRVDGDVWGAEPHFVTGDHSIAQIQPELTLLGPGNGDQIGIGQTVDITWSSSGDLGDVSLELSRDGGLTWELIIATTENDGLYNWLVTGPVTGEAKVRATAIVGLSTDVGPGLFTIYQPAGWVTVDPGSGTINNGLSATLTVNVDATGVAEEVYNFEVCIVDNTPASSAVIPLEITVRDATPVSELPIFQLRGNYPNPFNPTTIISFTLPETGHVDVEVLDIRGALVKRLFNGKMSSGDHDLRWTGNDNQDRQVAAGTYLLRIRTAGYQATSKMVLAK